jgi:hypothetical protein
VSQRDTPLTMHGEDIFDWRKQPLDPEPACPRRTSWRGVQERARRRADWPQGQSRGERLAQAAHDAGQAADADRGGAGRGRSHGPSGLSQARALGSPRAWPAGWAAPAAGARLWVPAGEGGRVGRQRVHRPGRIPDLAQPGWCHAVRSYERAIESLLSAGEWRQYEQDAEHGRDTRRAGRFHQRGRGG